MQQIFKTFKVYNWRWFTKLFYLFCYSLDIYLVVFPVLWGKLHDSGISCSLPLMLHHSVFTLSVTLWFALNICKVSNSVTWFNHKALLWLKTQTPWSVLVSEYPPPPIYSWEWKHWLLYQASHVKMKNQHFWKHCCDQFLWYSSEASFAIPSYPMLPLFYISVC